MTDPFSDLFALSDDIRYVALSTGGRVETRCRPHLSNASSSDSDLYEELLVNPTLLTMAGLRGDIDCGGLRYVVVGYGHFHQLVVPLPAGHVSIAFELDAEPARHVREVLDVIRNHGHGSG